MDLNNGNGQLMLPGTEKCLFGKHEVDLPEGLVEKIEIFTEVLSIGTWQNVLSDSQRRHLLTFLPSFPESDVLEKQRTIRQLFGGQNFKFGNPLKNFHSNLRDGAYSPDIAKYAALIRRSKMREYRYQQQLYYSNLLKEILVNRQRIIDLVTKLPPGATPKLELVRLPKPNVAQDKSLEQKAKFKYKQIIKEVNIEAGTGETTSEEDNGLDDNGSGKKILIKQEKLDEYTPTVHCTLEPKPELTNGDSAVPIRKRPILPQDISDDDIADLLRKHKRRRLERTDHPELDTNGITIEDIITRTQSGRKLPKGQEKNTVIKKKDRPRPKKLVKPGSEASISTFRIKEEPSDVYLSNDEDADSEISLNVQSTSEDNKGRCDNFFSLLRDLIKDEIEDRITTQKLEEKVREWQDSGNGIHNDWFSHSNNWVECVSSILNFLCGDILGFDNFVPYLDYKERAQQWKWIGTGRDSDEELRNLFFYWISHKEDASAQSSGVQPIPPPRVRTTYQVKPSSVEDKASFQQQEFERFSNPHRSYTYILHGYESVVGPVKGVYGKEASLNKAREHNLLINDRPAFVTILTLVRDAAARLPNGEGTRSDICELLRDSQFLSPNVTDSQVHNVVSGALDRLHYERDPCVQYDVNRKLWIYLHRNRTQEEFERIHQAQGAAAKAKKALQKPKMSRKSKEAVNLALSLTSVLNSSANTTNIDFPISTSPHSAPTPTKIVLTSPNSDTFVNVETVSPSSQAGSGTSPDVVTVVPPVQQKSSPKVVTKSIATSLIRTQSGTTSLLQSNLQQLVSTPTTMKPSQSLVGVVPAKTTVQSGGVSYVKQVISSGQTTGAASKPMSYSILQSQGGAKLVESLVQQQQQGGQQRRVLVTTGKPGSDPATAQKIIAIQQPQVSIVQSPGQSPSYVSSPVTPLPSPGGSPRTTASAVAGKPLLTRVVQQIGGQPQIINTQGGKPTAIKIQGNMVQTVGGKPASLLTQSGKPVTMIQTMHGATSGKPVTIQAVQSATSGKPLTIQGASGKPVTIQGATSGKPLTIQGASSGKPVTIQAIQGASGKPITLQTMPGSHSGKPMTIQAIQGASGKPVTIQTMHGGMSSGKPITIQTVSSGKPASMLGASIPMVKEVKVESPAATPNISQPQLVQHIPGQGGKPATIVITKSAAQVSGKPAATAAHAALATSAGKPIYIGGKPLSMVGGKPLIGGKPLSIGGKPFSIGGKPVHVIGGKPLSGVLQAAGQQGVVNIVTQAATGTVSQPKTTTKPASASLVSQILQTGSIQTTQPQVAMRQGTTVKLAAPPGAQVVNPGGNIVVTQLGAKPSQEVTAQGTKLVAVSQGTNIQGTPIIVQSSQAGQPKVVQQQLINAGAINPSMLSGNAGGQHIQLVKTVLSQPGGKPGHTAILLSQAANQSGATVVSSNLSQEQLNAAGIKTVLTQGAKGGKPMYARIINTQPGVRLQTIRPGQAGTSGQIVRAGQAQAGGQVTQVQEISVLQTAMKSDPGASVVKKE